MLLFACTIQMSAQAPGSSSSYKGLGIVTGGTHADGAESVYIGPGVYQIDGTWEIYSKYIVIDTGAIISGNGTIQIYNPSLAGGTSSRNYIDGNKSAHSIEVQVVLNNANGMEISEISGPFTNITTNNSLYIGKALNLAVDGADIWLDADVIGDLRFDNNATISNYGVNRMVITNNVNMSHMVKDAFSGTFFFPVGIADGDYTPASLTGNGPYNVSVTNYAASASIEQTPAEGMFRTWHIYGATATSMSLIHNSPATDGSSFTETQSFITQYQGSAVWSTKAASDRVSVGVNTSGNPASSIPTSATNLAYFTKTSDMLTPLPVQIISFDAVRNGSAALLSWTTIKEINNKGFEIERSLDGILWEKLGFANSKFNANSPSSLKYNFVDNNPVKGVNYYRLKQIDLDAKFAYSIIRSVIFDLGNNTLVYPNPSQNEVFVDGLAGNETICLYDAAGQIAINNFLVSDSKIRIPLDKLIPGIYFIRIIETNQEIHVHRIIKN